MKLRHTKKTTFFVEYNDFDNFVKNHYGYGFEFCANHEAINGSSYRFEIKKKKLDTWDTKTINDFIKTGKLFGFFAQTLLTDLANKELIKEGLYIINASW